MCRWGVRVCPTHVSHAPLMCKPRPHLVEVDNGEAVGLPGPRVTHTEEEPLRVLAGVEVKAQVQLIVPPAPRRRER